MPEQPRDSIADEASRGAHLLAALGFAAVAATLGLVMLRLASAKTRWTVFGMGGLSPYLSEHAAFARS